MAGVTIVPLAVSPSGHDSFRLPKELIVRLEAILVAGLWLSSAVAGRALKWSLQSRGVGLACAVALWALLTTVLSTQRQVSFAALGTCVSLAVLFLATVQVARLRAIGLAVIALAPAMVNAVICLLQAAGWSPFRQIRVTESRLARIGLQGNPNDVATYLSIATLLAIALAVAWRRGRRWAAAIAVLLGSGIVVTASLTAVAALVAALLAMAALASRRALLLAVAAAVLVTALAAVAYPPLLDRTRRLQHAVTAGNYDAALSSRVAPFVIALRMARDRPWIGMGPGTFGWHYFDYKIELERQQPDLLGKSSQIHNFAEAHNDHLQTLAEAGVPGYLLFVTCLAALASLSLRRGQPQRPASPQQALARWLSLPLAVLLGVLALAQFPLRMPAPQHLLVFLAALCCAWSKE